jgi:hypothetical protein
MNELSQLILHPDFQRTLEELSHRDVFLPPEGEPQNFSGSMGLITESGKLTALEEIAAYPVDAKAGCRLTEDFTLCAYDESWLRFEALEGTAYFTTHALVLLTDSDYVPVVLATFYFYTRSKAMTANSEFIKYSEAVDVDYHRDYLRDKVNFLLSHVPPKCLLLIDGPLISGDLYTIMSDANELLLEREILPVFFVKNSLSNVVTENIDGLRGAYNSDMHWLNELLHVGQRSSFFKYQDLHNPKNAKVFSYLKSVNSSPQRVEFHHETYRKYEESIPNIMDLVYYLMLVQGSTTNPQVRPIAVAEAYARSLLRYVDIDKQFKQAKITPTMNQVRFGG